MGRLESLLNALLRRRQVAPTGIRVAITAVDIEETIRACRGVREGHSPLVPAIRRDLGAMNVAVSAEAVTVVWGMTPPDVEVVPLPGVARRFHRHFEDGGPIGPLTFLLPGVAGPRELTGLPPAVGLREGEREIVGRIRDKARGLVDRAGEFAPESRDLYIVKQVLAAYLPDTIAGYTDLPGQWSQRVVGADGRTALQVLRDELALIEAEVDAIGDRLEHAKADQLLANERFLEDQFERRPNEPG